MSIDELDKANQFDKIYIYNENEIQDMFVYTDLAYCDNAEFQGNNYKPYYASIFCLIFLTGMRSGEARALYVDDIDFKKHTIKIYKSVSIRKNEEKIENIIKEPKTKNSRREIGITKETETIIKHIIDLRPNKKTKLLCTTASGNFISSRNFERSFDAFLKGANISKQERSIHALRHTFVSYAIEGNALSPLKNKNFVFISKYVGHANPDITLKVYTHISGHKLKDVDYNQKDTLSVCLLDNYDE